MIINPFDTPVDATGREQVVHGSADFPIACYFNDLVQFPVMMHWHEELEAGEHPCHLHHFALGHGGLIQAVCQRHRKGVHGQTDAQQNAVEKELETQMHL